MSRHHALIKNDPRWKTARRLCFERDDYSCTRCGVTADELREAGAGDQLEADHVVRLVDAPDQAFELDNLQTLCTPCHDEKEREYDQRQQLRVAWVHPAYPELRELVGVESGAPIL